MPHVGFGLVVEIEENVSGPSLIQCSFHVLCGADTPFAAHYWLGARRQEAFRAAGNGPGLSCRADGGAPARRLSRRRPRYRLAPSSGRCGGSRGTTTRAVIGPPPHRC